MELLPSPALIISGLALLVSITTAWLTLFRRGTLRMTQPALVGLLYDRPDEIPKAKVFFRALLYATGKRGHVIESMFVKVRRAETVQTFNYWAYGDPKSLVPGSGLRVGEEGVAHNHHFLPPRDMDFEFLPGEYRIEVYASVVSRRAPALLSTLRLTLTMEQAAALTDRSFGVLYNWGPEAQVYHAHIDVAPRERVHGGAAPA